MKALRLSLLFALSAFMAVQSLAGGRVLDSVTRNLRQARECLSTGRFAEAQAYAEMTLFTRTIRYSVVNDPGGVARTAVRGWETSLNGEIDFVEGPSNQADLQIVFAPKVVLCGRNVLGAAVTRRNVSSWSGGDYR